MTCDLRVFVVLCALGATVGCGRPEAGAAPAEAEAPRRQMALTFDDAPRGDGGFFSGPARADALIAALDEAGVRGAMFFVTTENIDRRADGEARLRAYAGAGHTLANHSHTHPSLQRTDVPAFLADIDTASGLLAGLPSVMPFFRYPFLHEGRTADQRARMEAALAERGLRNGYVTVDNYDWYLEALAAEAVRMGHDIDRAVLRDMYVETLMKTIAFYDDIARETLGHSPRHVLLLHENDLAAMYVGDLVGALRGEGWDFIPAAEAYEDPIATRALQTDIHGQGRVAAIAAEAGWAPRQLVHESEDEDYLRAEFVRRGLLPATGAGPLPAD